MANINASALNSLQTRINAERSRRSLSPVTFTDGTLSAGGTIKATHFAELRTYTEGLNTLGSQTFNWSGTVSVGASITDVITQISNFVTTLEGEALASWKLISPTQSINGGYNTTVSLRTFLIPTSAYAVGKVRWRLTALPSANTNTWFLCALQIGRYGTGYSSTSASGSWHVEQMHNSSIANTTLIHPPYTKTDFKPWSGSRNDNTFQGLQTPYSRLSGKGPGVNGAGLYNSGHGVVFNQYYANTYAPTANHWYYNKNAFDATFKYAALLSPGGVHGTAGTPWTTIQSNFQLEAYY
jgi:hypothetical protein